MAGSWHAARGRAGNPLVGMYYGDSTDRTGRSTGPSADCGYGVAQVTDGMRLAGRRSPARRPAPGRAAGDRASTTPPTSPPGCSILEEKWNQTYNARHPGQQRRPGRPENWFAARVGLQHRAQPAGQHRQHHRVHAGPSAPTPWQLGPRLGQQPGQPGLPARTAGRSWRSRQPGDAAHPQDWPYPEKVMGWAAYPIIKADTGSRHRTTPVTARPGGTRAGNRTDGQAAAHTVLQRRANNCVARRPGPARAATPTSTAGGTGRSRGSRTAASPAAHDNVEYERRQSAEPARRTHYPPVCSRHRPVQRCALHRRRPRRRSALHRRPAATLLDGPWPTRGSSPSRSPGRTAGRTGRRSTSTRSAAASTATSGSPTPAASRPPPAPRPGDRHLDPGPVVDQQVGPGARPHPPQRRPEPAGAATRSTAAPASRRTRGTGPGASTSSRAATGGSRSGCSSSTAPRGSASATSTATPRGPASRTWPGTPSPSSR